MTTEAGKRLLEEVAATGEPWRKHMAETVGAIEAEAAQQAIDGAALGLGLPIDPTKMSRNYIERAFAALRGPIGAEAVAAERARIKVAVEALLIPSDYVRDNGVDGKLTWPDGWDSAIERVLAIVEAKG